MPEPDPSPDRSPRPRWRRHLAGARRWAGPVLTAVLALVTVTVIWNKMRSDTWAYYSDAAGERIEIDDERARPVLWEDPEPHLFEAGEANTPTGRIEAAFSADGTRMLLVRWQDGERNADLFHATWDGRVWSKPEALAALNTAFNERGPALSRDGNYLYFASDRKGGAGGYDLYVSRWNGAKWSEPEALPSKVNTAANELGPALSPDGAQLFFSSDGSGSEDILVSQLTPGESGKKVKSLPPLPGFARAEAVSSLNSEAAEVEAALTTRGDSVFLASDRARTRKLGFKVYFSRVIDGETLPPEQVDLYLESGDATDPAVRMEGFDLLFSSNQEAAGDDAGDSGFRLFRSTTREVIGYTDLSRWEQFKKLMSDIAWWILLAIAALLALIYILEKWRDMTSLFHKCLAGSGLVHLIALLLAMLWLIAREVSEDQGTQDEMVLDMDALTQEELALESVPEEIELTETDTQLETQKEESEFGAPGFEPQEEAAAVEAPAQTTKEAVVEAQPQLSEPAAQDLPPAETLPSELAASALPEIELPEMEEREMREPVTESEPVNEIFEPALPMVAAEQSRPQEFADTPTESEAEVTEAQVAEATPQPVESAVEVALPTPVELPPSEQPALESAMLAELAPEPFVDPTATPLEETQATDGQPDSAPADPAADLFNPGSSLPNLATAPAPEGSAADAAVAAPAESGAVAAGDLVAESPTTMAAPATAHEAEVTESLPAPPSLDSASPTPLPELALDVPVEARMEERELDPDGAPANPAAEMFKPGEAAPNLATSPAERATIADAAMATRSETREVESGDPVSESSALTARPTMSSSSATELPTAQPVTPGGLPATALVDPGLPQMEELAAPAGAPADASRDQFAPAGAPSLMSSKLAGPPHSDTAVTKPGAAAAVGSGARVAEPSALAARPAASAATSEGKPVTPALAVGPLPKLAVVDPGAVTLEEPGKNAAGRAEEGKDQFKPGAASALATNQTQGNPGSGKAMSDAPAAAAVVSSTAEGRESVAISGTGLEVSGGPLPAGELITVDLGSPGVLSDSLLPGELEAPAKALEPGEMAKIIQKSRGKPGIDTIKERGGSDGTEKAIKAAINWLANVQEENGHWDTKKFGAKQDYDTGGTGLALLCFYGWGESHSEGEHKDTVRKALDWLLKQQDEEGYLGVWKGNMYSHAIATIALCEAYGMTKDAKLKEPAERAIAFTLRAQSKSRGGWRYHPGDDADTSVTGWQYMALHSARMAGLEVPEENFVRVRKYLDRVGGGKHGGLYGYQRSSNVNPAMVATGMFCRQLDLVAPSGAMMQESARHLKVRPLKTPDPDFYYIYYATLALYQHQGPIWTAWNDRLKDALPDLQDSTGGNAGSWDPSSGITGQGGRVVSTCLATLSLEVYYRLLPMYGFRNDEAEAPEVKVRGE